MLTQVWTFVCKLELKRPVSLCDVFDRWQTVIDLMRSMREEGGLAPSVKSYNVVMEALSKTGEWKRTLSMLEQMKKEGVRPTEFTYTRCMTGTVGGPVTPPEKIVLCEAMLLKCAV